MVRNASLGDFDASEDSGPKGSADGQAEPTRSDGNDAGGAEALTSTMVVAGEARCNRCGGKARRRWREDAELVCRDCKTW